jgi:lipopolysaccharide export system permease protein
VGIKEQEVFISMISILERYIAKTIASATGLATLVITGISFLMLLLEEMKNVGEGDYGVAQMLIYAIMRLPNQVYQFAPMIMLLGSVIGLSVLTSNRELAVMRTSGFSMQRIIRSVLYVAVFIVFLFTLLGEFVAPQFGFRAEVNKENAQNAGQAVVTSKGVWYHLGDSFIHVQQMVGRQMMQGVTRYQFNNKHQLMATYFAKTLAKNEKEWMMYNVSKTSFYNERTKSEFIPQMPWDLKFNTSLLNVGLVEANEMTLPKLAKFVNYLESNNLTATQYKFEFWQRALQPIASLIMILLAIPFVLGARISPQLGWRIIIAVIAGFGFFILNSVLSQLSIVYQLPALFSAMLPLLIFGFAALVLMQKLMN